MAEARVLDRAAVVHHAVDDGLRQLVARENGASPGELDFGGEYDRAATVAFGDYPA